MDGGRPERRRSGGRRGPRGHASTNRATRSGSLRGRSPGTAGARRPTRHRRRRPGWPAARRPRWPGQAAGEGDRHFPGDRGGQSLGGARPGPARMRAARGVEEEPLDARREVGTATRRRASAATAAASAARRPADGGPSTSGAADRARRRDGFGAAELDDVGVDRGDDRGRGPSRRGVGGDRDDRAAGRRPRRASRASRARSAASSSASSRGVPGTTFSPIASAPAATAARTPVGVGDAADLDERPARDVGRIVRGGARRRRTRGPRRPDRATAPAPRRRARHRTRARASGRRSPGRERPTRR